MSHQAVSKMDSMAIYKLLAISIVFAAVGALLNLFPISVGHHIQLFFGNVAFLVAASFFRPYYVLPIALVTIVPCVISGMPNEVSTMYLVEAVLVSVARTLGFPVLVSSSVLWLIVVLPVIVVFQRGQLSVDYWLYCLQLMVNGLLMAAIAQLIVDGLKLSGWGRLSQYSMVSKKESMSHVLIRVLCAFAMLLSLAVGLSLNHDFEKRLAAEQHQQMKRETAILSAMLEEYVQGHVAVIETLAAEMANLDNASAQALLTNVHSTRPGFISMIRADAKGNILQAVPADMLAGLPTAKRRVIDRDYFIEPMLNKRSFISEPFVGRGFGRDIIVALSAPILDENDNVNGVVEGSLNLDQIGRFHSYDKDDKGNKFVVVDANQRVLFAHDGLGLSKMDGFHLLRRGEQVVFETQQGVAYTLAGEETPHGWQVYVLRSNGLNLLLILQHFSSLFITLGLILAAAVLISLRLALSMSAPIVKLIDVIRDHSELPEDINEIEIEEIHTLFSTFDHDRRDIVHQQKLLQDQFQRRTMDLLEANNRLTRLAFADPLTGLNNAKALNERFAQLRSLAHRNEGRLMFLCVDVDYFQRINDSYGHASGDRCLKYLANVLTDCFQRDYDIVARVGEDEFFVVTQVFEWRALNQYIDACRVKIESIAIPLGEGRAASVTVSMGGFVADASWSQSCQDWLEIAHQAKDEAKKQGKNCLVTWRDEPHNPIALPSHHTVNKLDESARTVCIEPLNEDHLRGRFERLRSTIERSGGALLVMKLMTTPSHSESMSALNIPVCKQLLNAFKRGYDTIAMVDEIACLIVTAVSSPQEATRLIERALSSLPDEQAAALAIGAVAAEAGWSNDFSVWLAACEQEINVIKPTATKRYQLLNLMLNRSN